MKHLCVDRRWRAPGTRARRALPVLACAFAVASAMAAPTVQTAGEMGAVPATEAAEAAAGALAESRAGYLAAPGVVLALLNAQRAAGAVCGGETMPPAPPLQWHLAMEQAAADHLQDVATRPALTHVGLDGSSVGGRVWRHGYRWGGVAENVAGGPAGAAATLGQWLASPSHCRTLMGARYDHVGVVGRHVPGSRLLDYWVMVVARPLR